MLASAKGQDLADAVQYSEESLDNVDAEIEELVGSNKCPSLPKTFTFEVCDVSVEDLKKFVEVGWFSATG